MWVKISGHVEDPNTPPRVMAPDPSEDDEEEIGRKEIFDNFLLPWLLLAVLAIVWFLVPPGD
jgi:hypothetical protein